MTAASAAPIVAAVESESDSESDDDICIPPTPTPPPTPPSPSTFALAAPTPASSAPTPPSDPILPPASLSPNASFFAASQEQGDYVEEYNTMDDSEEESARMIEAQRARDEAEELLKNPEQKASELM